MLLRLLESGQHHHLPRHIVLVCLVRAQESQLVRTTSGVELRRVVEVLGVELVLNQLPPERRLLHCRKLLMLQLILLVVLPPDGRGLKHRVVMRVLLQRVSLLLG